MALIRWIGLFVSLILIGTSSLAQDSTMNELSASSNPKLVVVEVLPVKSLFKRYHQRTFAADQLADLQEELVSTAYREGFIAPTVALDTVGDTIALSLSPGAAFEWANLSVDESTRDIMRQAGVRVRRIEGRAVSPRRLSAAREKVITHLENNGYPFASIRLDSVEFTGALVSAKFNLEPGPFVTIDSVVIKGDIRIRETYITNYLGVHEGGAYNEKLIRQSSAALKEVPFISEIKPAEVLFSEDKTKLFLYLNQRNASRFDGIIGFLPDNNTGELLITGDVKLHLENALRQGESFDLNWRKLQTNTQELTAEAVAPFVLNSPFGLDGNLKLYRRDTLFSDVFRQLGFRYKISRLNFLRLFIDRQTTNLISTAQYENTITIPPYLDRAITSYGLSLRYGRVDYRLNPSRGIEVYLEGAAGTKVIEENARLPTFIYDSLDLRTLQIRSRVDAGYYISILPRLIWHQRGLGAMLVNDQLFNNEAYRIGGLLTLRGFDEESIFATSFAIGRNELRYQIDQDGYLFGFFDVAYYENNSLNAIGAKSDIPYGFGAGINFGTRAGVFSLTYALGSQRGNPILFRAGKIHFGFVSLF